jgi:hypothetical protein
MAKAAAIVFQSDINQCLNSCVIWTRQTDFVSIAFYSYYDTPLNPPRLSVCFESSHIDAS